MKVGASPTKARLGKVLQAKVIRGQWRAGDRMQRSEDSGWETKVPALVTCENDQQCQPRQGMAVLLERM